jgi:hypothetical protein
VEIRNNSDTALRVLDGIYTPAELLEENGDPIDIPIVDVPGAAENADGDVILGAVSADNDWTAGWTFGLNSEAMWFDKRCGDLTFNSVSGECE